MALAKLLNSQPSTGALAIYALANLLVGSAGWSKVKDSDGSAFSSSGTQVTSGNAGAHGLGNDRAFVVLRSPDSSLYLSFQHENSAANTRWRVKVSTAAPTGGSATQVPAASDDQLLAGGGTDGSPTFADEVIGGSDGSGYHVYIVAQTVAPYLFCMFGYDTNNNLSAGEVHTLICLDAVQSWTLTTGDTFQYVLHAASPGGGGDACNFSALSYPELGAAGDTSFRSWLAKGLAGAGFVPVPVCSLNSDNGGTVVTPGNQALNPASGKYDLFPLIYDRRSDAATAPRGFKGLSTLFSSSPLPFPTIKTGDKFTAAATGDNLVLGSIVLNLWENDSLSGTGTSPTTRQGRIFTAPTITPDTTLPVVTWVSPSPGSVIGPNTPLVVNVTDNVGLARALVKVILGQEWELPHDGAGFSPRYAAGSTRTAISGGYQFSLVRAGGWVGSPIVEPIPIDTSGNVAA